MGSSTHAGDRGAAHRARPRRRSARRGSRIEVPSGGDLVGAIGRRYCRYSIWSSMRDTPASSGEALTWADLSGEAIRPGRLVSLEPLARARGVRAARAPAAARTAAQGTDLVGRRPRFCWRIRIDRSGMASRSPRGRELARTGARLREDLGRLPDPGGDRGSPAERRDAAATDWAQIVALYDVLVRVRSRRLSSS